MRLFQWTVLEQAGRGVWYSARIGTPEGHLTFNVLPEHTSGARSGEYVLVTAWSDDQFARVIARAGAKAAAVEKAMREAL